MNLHLSKRDLFDDIGQFCDKGKSYRSVIFYQSENEKIISKQLKRLEEKFKTKIFVLQWKFEKFYGRSSPSRLLRKKKFINYLLYKSMR